MIISPPVGSLYWFVGSLLFLGIMAFQDFRHGRIDDRYNFYMYGMTSTLLVFMQRPWWYYFVFIFIGILIFAMLHRTRFGRGDANTLLWILPGLGIIAWWYVALYIIALILIILSLYFSLFVGKKYGWFAPSKIPFHPFIFCTFVITALVIFWTWGLY